MNRRVSMIGAAVAGVSVFLFALCMIVRYPFGSYLERVFPAGERPGVRAFPEGSFLNGRFTSSPGILFIICRWPAGNGGFFYPRRKMPVRPSARLPRCQVSLYKMGGTW